MLHFKLESAPPFFNYWHRTKERELMKANYYAKATFQTKFSDEEPFYGKKIIEEHQFGKDAGTIILLGNIDEDFSEVIPSAIIVEHFSFDNDKRSERLILLTKKQIEDPYELLKSILENEFGLNYSDDDQEMAIDTISESLMNASEFEPYSLGKIYTSHGVLEAKKFKSSDAHKINYLLFRNLAHCNEGLDFGKQPSKRSVIEKLNDAEGQVEWLDDKDVFALALKA